MQKKLITIFLVFTSLFTLTACFSTYPSYEKVVETRSKIAPIPFTKEKWFDDGGIGFEAFWQTRPGLARDLVNRNLLIEKSYAEVQDLLGEQSKDVTENSTSYSLFYDMGFADPIYGEYLYIKFDKDDRAISNEIKIEMMDGHPDYR